MQTASFVCGHTIGPLGGIGKAVGWRAGCGCVLEIIQQKRRAEQKGRKGCGQWVVVSPRLRTDTPRHALGHLHPPQLSRRFGFWGGHGESCAWSCLARRQASSELSFAGAAVLQNIVLGVPAVVATLRVGSAISCRWRDDHSPTASARAVFIARQRLLFPQAGGLLSQGAVAAKALVLWIGA